VIDVTQAPVKHYATIDSTNSQARRLHDAGERGPFWVLADEQTAGRGRLARKWVSEKGNLYSTLVLPTTYIDVTILPQIGFVVALAVSDVAMRHAGDVKLKWPNDVLVGGAKVSGILCEVLSPDVIAIGCGINVAHAPQGLNYPATHLRVTTSDEVFAHYGKQLSHWLAVWQAGFPTIRDTWMSRAMGIGEAVTMTVQSQVHTGVFEGIDHHGAIILKKPDGFYLTLHAGDLTIPSLQAQRKQSA
jgi:BirA family transcriptional regulator, biotin operon repressor / biotin---[acetyl-CoA-carboxylase] ligase